MLKLSQSVFCIKMFFNLKNEKSLFIIFVLSLFFLSKILVLIGLFKLDFYLFYYFHNVKCLLNVEIRIKKLNKVKTVF